MSETQSTFKTIAEAQPEITDDAPEKPVVRRHEIVQVTPQPGIEQVDEFGEWCELADVVRDSVVAAINEDA